MKLVSFLEIPHVLLGELGGFSLHNCHILGGNADDLSTQQLTSDSQRTVKGTVRINALPLRHFDFNSDIS